MFLVNRQFEQSTNQFDERDLTNLFFFDRMVSVMAVEPSGKARLCKSLIVGSNPSTALIIKFFIIFYLLKIPLAIGGFFVAICSIP